MKVVQINVSANRGSTGKIAEGIGQLVLDEGWESHIAYGGSHRPSKSELISIGGKCNLYCHALQSRLLDNHGLASRRATMRFVDRLKELKPDIVHLHNIHDYYLNYPILFSYLQSASMPVVWTLHDCWPFTGHCAYFDQLSCEKWKTECYECKGLSTYPKSWWMDCSRKNFARKKKTFTSLGKRLTLVPVSHWLERFAKESFMRGANIQTIQNGIDITTFKPYYPQSAKSQYGIDRQFVILGVAARWDERKGLKDFIQLRHELSREKYAIILVGLTEKQIKSLPNGIVGVVRTDSPQELASIYSMADVFFNPTYEDNYPTTNLEAISCGTPVLCYDTGGCKEAVVDGVGKIVEKGCLKEVLSIIKSMQSHSMSISPEKCRKHAEMYFDEKKAFKAYLELYKDALNQTGGGNFSNTARM